MPEREYSDFDLVIERAGRRFRARVLNLPEGREAAAEFGLRIDRNALENFVLRMGLARSTARHWDSPAMEAVKILGGRLFSSVFTGDVHAAYVSRLAEAHRREQGLRIRLHIEVPQFHNLPWEYLYDPDTEQFLALSGDTPIIRYMELPVGDTPEALSVALPLKILVMISSPKEYPQLNVEEEWRRLNEALQPLIERGQVVLRRLEQPTLSALRQNLRNERPHILHFIGHGRFLEHEQDGKLLLEDERGAAAPVRSDILAQVLYDYRNTLRLVVLNACEGARTSTDDPYAGVAQMLVRRGIPAVIAMQFQIFEQAAVTLAREFYKAVADGLPVDAALSEARVLIYSLPNDVEWGTPVLFMRAADGVLFRVQAADVSALLAAAKAAMLRDDWPGAISALQKALAQSPGHAEAKELLAEAYLMLGRKGAPLNMFDQGDWQARARVYLRLGNLEGAERIAESILEVERHNKDAARLLMQIREMKKQQAGLEADYAAARGRLEDRQWREAIELLERIEKTEPGYKDVPQLLEQARGEQAAQELHEWQWDVKLKLAQQYNEAGKWGDAADLLKEILQADPGHKAAKDLLEQINAERQKRERGNFLEATYKAAGAKLDAKDWENAIDGLESIEKMQPDYKDVPDLLKKARAGQKAEQDKLDSLNERYERAMVAVGRAQWQQAIGLLENLDREAPLFRDVRGQLSRARLEDQYEQARGKMEARQWNSAVALLEAIQNSQPLYQDGSHAAYKDVPDLLKRARSESWAEGLLRRAGKTWREGNGSAAIVMVEKILEEIPDHAGAQQLMKEFREQLDRARAKEAAAEKERAEPPLPDQIDPHWMPPEDMAAEARRREGSKLDLTGLLDRANKMMDAGRWQEARALLEGTDDPGYRKGLGLDQMVKLNNAWNRLRSGRSKPKDVPE